MPTLTPSGQGAVTGVSLTGGPPGLLLQKQAQFETEDPLERKRLKKEQQAKMAAQAAAREAEEKEANSSYNAS